MTAWLELFLSSPAWWRMKLAKDLDDSDGGGQDILDKHSEIEIGAT